MGVAECQSITGPSAIVGYWTPIGCIEFELVMLLKLGFKEKVELGSNLKFTQPAPKVFDHQLKQLCIYVYITHWFAVNILQGMVGIQRRMQAWKYILSMARNVSIARLSKPNQ